MAGIDDHEAVQLRASLQQMHQRFAEAEQGSDSYNQRAVDILNAAMNVLDTEASAKAKAAKELQAKRARHIRAVGAATTGGLAVFSVIYLAAGWIGLGWLILLAPLTVAAAVMAWRERRLVGGGDQEVRVFVAWALGASGLLTAVILARVVPGWVLFLAIPVDAIFAFMAVRASLADTAATADRASGREEWAS